MAMLGYAFWIALHPANSYAGLVLQRETEFDEATQAYFSQRLTTTLAAIKASEIANQEVDLNLYLSAASDAYSLGNFVMAREMLEKQLIGNPINYVAWNNYAIVLEDMEDYEAAESAYLHTIQLEPGNNKYYVDYADFLLNNYPERRDDLKALIEDDLMRRGQTVWNMTSLGDWYAAGGVCDKAIDHYQVAIVLLPDNQALKDDLTSLKNTCIEVE